jgi:YfiR/HmsC-like
LDRLHEKAIYKVMIAGKRYRMLPHGAAALLILAGFLPLSVLAGEVPGEAEVKAAFVFNFIKFVEWPSSAFHSPEDPILLSVLGNDPTGAALASLDGKKVSGRRVVVRKVPVLSGLERCHVLFVGASEKTALAPVLRAAQGWPVLTVADFEGFAGRGGTIGFVRQDDRVGFEISEETARKVGLKVNAKLLYLGKSVRGGKGGER